MSTELAADRRIEPTDCDDQAGPASDLDVGALDLLNDEYAREILRELRDGPRPARELIERTAASKPTVYRRLDRLEATGLVASETTPHPEGHHRLEYRIAVDRIVFELGQDMRVRSPDPPRS